MLEKIVAGYAQDQAGRDAVALAGELAAVCGSQITVAFPYHPALSRETAEQAQERIAAEVAPMLAVEPSFHWSPSSWPIRALHELAAYERAQLIVVGAARDGVAAHLKVSLMERMVHGAPCAVAVAPEAYADSHELKRIGVGFSSSHEGRAAIRLARALAGAGGGSLRVIAGAGLEPALASYAFSSPALAEVEDEIYADVERTLARACEELAAEDGVPIEHETVRGDPAALLIERSSQLDLLVLGSRAYGPLRHAFLGSVSAQAMREARCPVLVVPRGAEGASGHPDEQTAAATARV